MSGFAKYRLVLLAATLNACLLPRGTLERVTEVSAPPAARPVPVKAPPGPAPARPAPEASNVAIQLQPADLWFGIAPMGHKSGYARIIVQRNAGSTHIKLRKRIFESGVTTVRDIAATFDPEGQLIDFQISPNGRNRIEPQTRPLAPTRAVPLELLGLLATRMPRRMDSKISWGVLAEDGSPPEDGYFHVVGRTWGYYYERNLNGWVVHYLGPDRRIRRTFLVDDLGNLLVSTDHAGFWYEEHWLLESTPERALNGLPADILVDPRDRAVVPEAPRGVQLGPGSDLGDPEVLITLLREIRDRPMEVPLSDPGREILLRWIQTLIQD